MNRDLEFSARLAAVCGTDKVADIQRLLNISYQAAKNYMAGRVPTPAMLVQISDATGCSIDWLLTGRGKKFLDAVPAEDTPLTAGQIASVRSICVEVINEMNGAKQQPRIVRLQSSDLMSEAVPDPAATPTGRRP